MKDKIVTHFLLLTFYMALSVLLFTFLFSDYNILGSFAKTLLLVLASVFSTLWILTLINTVKNKIK